MNNTNYKYRPDLLEQINVPHRPVFESYNTLEQARKLSDLGVTVYSSKVFFENIAHICVRPETVPDSERQHYTSITTVDEFGFSIEVLVEDVVTFGEPELGDWNGALMAAWEVKSMADPDNTGKVIVKEYNRYPGYSEHELEQMYLNASRENEIPRHEYGKWAVVHRRSNDTLDVKLFDNRAEALAQGIIDFLTAAPVVRPKVPKLELRPNINFSSPEAQARMAIVQKSVDSLNSHKQPRRCHNGCANCQCNPVYGTSR